MGYKKLYKIYELCVKLNKNTQNMGKYSDVKIFVLFILIIEKIKIFNFSIYFI